MDIGSLTGQIALEDQLTGKLTSVMSSVRKFAENFDGAMGAVAIGAGALAAAVAGAAISIVTLGEKGSVILGVEDAFNRLAEAAGHTGEALIGALSEGVQHTVDSMELMQSVSRAMTAGVKLNVDDMQLLGEAARAMGKATGTDATQGLQTLSSALTTGRTRGLAMAGIVVDLTRAEDVYAASLGVTKDQLSDTEKLEAKRIAILDATRTYVERLGVSTLSFKERMDQAQVAIGNWFDSLAKAVAVSEPVMRAFDSIKMAIEKAFGGGSQTLLEWTVKWVNRFADAVSTYAPSVIAAFGWIYDKVRAIWTAVTEAWDLVPDWLKNIARDAALAAAAVYLTTKSVDLVIGSFKGLSTASTESSRSVVSEWGTITSALIDTGRVLQKVNEGIPAIRAAIDGIAVAAFLVAPGLALIAGSLVAIAATAAIVTAGYQLWKLWAEDAERAASATRQLVTDGANLERLNESMGTSFATLAEATEAWYTTVKDLPTAIIPLTAEQERAAQAAKMHEEQISKLFNTFAAASAHVDVTSEAFNRLTGAQKASSEVQALVIPLLDARIAKGIELTAAESSYYEQVVTSRLNLEAYNLTMFAASEATLEEVQALQALGMTLPEIAAKFGSTVLALNQFIAEAQKIKALSQEIADEKMRWSTTATDQAIANIEREFQAEVAALNEKSPMYMQHYDKLRELSNMQVAAVGVDLGSMTALSQEHALQMAAAEKRKYDSMRFDGLTFSREVLDEQKKKWQDLEYAARHYGQAVTTATAEATISTNLLAGAMADLLKLTWMAADAAKILRNQSYTTDLDPSDPRYMPEGARRDTMTADPFDWVWEDGKGPEKAPRFGGMGSELSVPRVLGGPSTSAMDIKPGGGVNITNHFLVNGHADDVARKIKETIMRDLKQVRQYGAA